MRHWQGALPNLRVDAAHDVGQPALFAGECGAVPLARGVAAARRERMHQSSVTGATPC